MRADLSPEQQARLDAILARPDAERMHGRRISEANVAGVDLNTELTRRELEVLSLVAQGLTNAEVGAELFIGEETVKSYVKVLLSKLEARNRAHAVWLARDQIAA